VALSASTGRPVIGVFHTLSAGKAGHWVPGRLVPADCAVTDVGATPAVSPVMTAMPTAALSFRADLYICRPIATTNADRRRSANVILSAWSRRCPRRGHITDLNDIFAIQWAMSFAPTPLPVSGPRCTAALLQAAEAKLEVDIGDRLAHHHARQ
jgi:hypothetical protein